MPVAGCRPIRPYCSKFRVHPLHGSVVPHMGLQALTGARLAAVGGHTGPDRGLGGRREQIKEHAKPDGQGVAVLRIGQTSRG